MSDDPDFSFIVKPERVQVLTRTNSRAAVFRTVGGLIASDPQGLDSHEVIGALLKREQEGSTALDDSGAAIPHCRLASCQEPIGCLLRLDRNVKFASQEVDIVFALVVPKESQNLHLRILQTCARVFSNPSYLAALRSCEDGHALHLLFQEVTAESLAA